VNEEAKFQAFLRLMKFKHRKNFMVQHMDAIIDEKVKNEFQIESISKHLSILEGTGKSLKTPKSEKLMLLPFELFSLIWGYCGVPALPPVSFVRRFWQSLPEAYAAFGAFDR
jgi:hypothetical protein